MLKQRVQSAFIMLGLFILTYFYLEYIFFEFLVLAVGGFLLFELSHLLYSFLNNSIPILTIIYVSILISSVIAFSFMVK